MTSYAELLAACTEFQENFASLNGKYNAAAQELQNARAANERLSKQLTVMREGEDRLQGTIRELKQELQEARAYKDRYLAANVSVEHLKGRLENARRAMADKMLEHEQQVEQLRGQIRDLLQRVSVFTDAQATQQLKKQVVELQERCAEQNGHLLEEKERGSQQLLTAHTALREQQARGLELEQRCRTLEAEITQMRSVVRRSADLQNEAAVAKEKSASEARRAVMQAESIATELRETQARLSAAAAVHVEELEAAKAAADAEASQLLERVSQLSAAVDDAVAARTAEQERYAALQRSVHERAEMARAEARLEVAALQKSLSEARAEAQQTAWRLEQTQMELEESRLRSAAA
ncbi:golgi familyn subfamily A member 1 [Trypanosoma rangeli]|uniref:Golgi familyn subfamily A member 1 n=1 Tax=Trypanosoma rangeli TaxID=5698 RepID=A0A422NKM0_TRYRA|nr:golgi familyn subfamily A member 1 [Trypanosoma rangeli]RNF06042.1 golgi familyn subfamily A member 1 [Trypanosoma rangeli]|eukprot:RNF06042.1 golgi familyn subfamily A member 1 [Trypanosoma rangeli]